MRDARAVRKFLGRSRVDVALAVLGLFSWTKKKGRSRTPAPQLLAVPNHRVAVEGARKQPDLPAPEPSGPVDPLRQDLRFQGLHEDINPSRSVRPSEMTCPGCDRQFRFFLNANGSKTPVACPGCGRQYRL